MRVAAVQLSSGADRDANLASADRLTRAAAADGASVVVLPEKWTAMGSDEQLLAAAEPLEGPTLEWARSIARELGVDLVAGSFCERVPGREKLANTCVHVDPRGELRAVYRKLHMFDVEVDGVTYAESRDEEPGEDVVVSQLMDGSVVGMSICYDIRFPELYRTLVGEGAQVVAALHAFLAKAGDKGKPATLGGP